MPEYAGVWSKLLMPHAGQPSPQFLALSLLFGLLVGMFLAFVYVALQDVLSIPGFCGSSADLANPLAYLRRGTLTCRDTVVIESIQLQGACLVVGVISACSSSPCPLCDQASSQIHSFYQRTLRDLPCAGRNMVLHLSLRKFFCRNPGCPRKIFTERFPTFVKPWARVTLRLFEAVQAIGQALGGELGTRLADRLSFHTKLSTILRRIMALPALSSPQVSLLGIDDWSFRRGRK